MELMHDISLTRWVVATLIMAAMLGAFALVVYKVRHPQLGRGAQRLHLLARLPLDARHSICLLQVDDMQHTIVLGGQTPIVLASCQAPAEPVAQEAVEHA